jgi:hypothetical protein
MTEDPDVLTRPGGYLTRPGKPFHPLLPRLSYWGKGEG